MSTPPPLALIIDHAVATAMADLLGPVVTALAPVASLVVAGVLALAGLAKTIGRQTTVAEFTSLGLPHPGVLARIVPPAELALAGLVLVRPGVGGPLAAVALLAFTAVLARALRSGRSVSCGCLGPLSRRPVSGATLARNGVLVGLALVAAASPARSGWSPILPDVEVVLATGPALLVVALGAQLLVLRAQIGRIWSVELAGEATGGRRTRHPNPPTGGPTD